MSSPEKPDVFIGLFGMPMSRFITMGPVPWWPWSKFPAAFPGCQDSKTIPVMVDFPFQTSFSRWGVPKMRDPQKRWMVFVRENPYLEMDGDWGYPYDFGNHHIWCLFQASKSGCFTGRNPRVAGCPGRVGPRPLGQRTFPVCVHPAAS